MRVLALGTAWFLAACSVAAPSTPPQTVSSSSYSTALPAGRLPVATGNGNDRASGGFLLLPNGQFLADTAAELDVTGGRMSGPPGLRGAWPGSNVPLFPSYDIALKRWVPVSYRQISPDEGRYAYHAWVAAQAAGPGPTGPSLVQIHVVDVASGADRVVYTGQRQQVIEVIGFGVDGIYVAGACLEGCAPSGLLLLDPSTGAVKTILADGSSPAKWEFVVNGAAWGLGGVQPSAVLYRLDLSTKHVAPWFTPKNAAAIIGVDGAGNPLLEAQDPYTGAVELWGASSATSGSRLLQSSTVIHFNSAVSDSSGTWLGSSAGLYRLNAAGHLQQVPVAMTLGAGGLVVAGDFAAV